MTVGPVTLTSLSIVEETQLATVTSVIELPPPIVVETFTLESTLVTNVPGTTNVQTEVVQPASTVIITVPVTQTILLTSTIVETSVLQPVTSMVTQVTQVIVSEVAAPIFTTLTVTNEAPTIQVTEIVEQPITDLQTVTSLVNAPPEIVTLTLEQQQTVLMPPVIVTVTEMVTLPPVPFTVTAVDFETVSITSTILETLFTTLTTVVPLETTLTVFMTQLTTETLTVTPTATETALSTVLQTDETVLTLTTTVEQMQTVTNFMTFTLTSIVPSTITITEAKANMLFNDQMHDMHDMMPYQCTCPILSCPPQMPCTPCTVTVTQPCPTMPAAKMPFPRGYY
jgi:hypothetical protein